MAFFFIVNRIGFQYNPIHARKINPPVTANPLGDLFADLSSISETLAHYPRALILQVLRIFGS